FSSRRRHTRCLSDWSSDVCSSDLELRCGAAIVLAHQRFFYSPAIGFSAVVSVKYFPGSGCCRALKLAWHQQLAAWPLCVFRCLQIGRASCRERGLVPVGDGYL